uniref:Uncharacterized protein n=1 Tax=Arundo donax TaxID=35708 RepID=A0A0A9F3P2_ARUDO
MGLIPALLTFAVHWLQIRCLQIFSKLGLSHVQANCL